MPVSSIPPVQPSSEPVEDNLEEFIEKATVDLFEMLAEAEKVEDVPEPEPEPEFREQAIVPTEDVGPRFTPVDQPLAQPVVSKPAAVLQPAPKRHPRNIPKFSRTK
jgi:hypothetical protein